MPSPEVIIKLTEEQREQVRVAMGNSIGSVVLIEMCCDEPDPTPPTSELTTISST